jgi:hypothetical protein
VRVGVALDAGPADVVLRTIRCVAGVEVLSAPLDQLGALDTFSLLVIDRGSAALFRTELLANTVCRLLIVTDDLDDEILELAQRQPQVVGVMVAPEQALRSWELTYAMRRLMFPDEEPPLMGTLLAWGATTVSWLPTNTAQQQRMVDLIERTCVSLGLERRVADVVGTAAHELSINAMYAPTDAQQVPLRGEELSLAPEQAPEIRLTIDGAYIAIDCTDKLGGLTRQAFFDAISRGRRSALRDEGSPTRGAGLGLHTLFAAGSVLRAEVLPGKLSLVSWAYDRARTGRTRRQTPRSLWFF